MQKNVRTKVFLLKAMRMTVTQLMLLVSFCGLASARDSKAQEVLNATVSLKIEAVEIRKVFGQIEKQADVKFVYSPNTIRSNQKVSLATTNKLSEVLKELLTPLDISYEVVGTRILLRKKIAEKASSLEERESPMSVLEPQEQIVKGKITDAEHGEGLPGVSILLKGTQKGTTTNPSGEFSIAVPDEKAVLVFSFVGYEPQEIVVGNRTLLNVSLKADTKALGEVVVVGYGTQRAKDVTGAVATINQATIKFACGYQQIKK
ncbi:MAG: carboxypeptidase-like regulatory domain-containing protein [Spirosomataceae bacterium]